MGRSGTVIDTLVTHRDKGGTESNGFFYSPY